MIKDAPSSRQLPHVERRAASKTTPEAAALFADRCGSVAVDVVPGSEEEWLLGADEKKYVLAISMPPVEGSPRYRKTVMAEHGAYLSSFRSPLSVPHTRTPLSERLLSIELDRIAGLASNYLVIYAGSHIPLERRQLPSLSEFDSPPDTMVGSSNVSAAATAARSTQGGILHNYQLLTPALITSLLVAFFILVPIVMLGISALASIQSTLRSEAPMDYSAQEKKTQ